MKRLKWVGETKGLSFVPGHPAADFDCEDDTVAEELVAGGAYEYAPPARSSRRGDQEAPPAGSERTDVSGGEE
jgi:hypothetical protein